jgi:hypothetical protein
VRGKEFNCFHLTLRSGTGNVFTCFVLKRQVEARNNLGTACSANAVTQLWEPLTSSSNLTFREFMGDIFTYSYPKCQVKFSILPSCKGETGDVYEYMTCSKGCGGAGGGGLLPQNLCVQLRRDGGAPLTLYFIPHDVVA